MARHHLKFRNFRPEILAAAGALFDAKPWSIEDDDEWLKVAQSFTDQVSNAYGVRSAVVELEPRYRRRTRVRYEPAQMEHSALSADNEVSEVSPPKIVLTGRSIIVLFKGVRTNALAQGDIEAVSYDDPWSWACSLFYAVRPVMFRARARQRRIKDVTARDTYGSETWEAMRQAGVTRGDWLAPGMDNFDPRTLQAQVSESDLEEFTSTLTDPDVDSLPDSEEIDTELNADDGEDPAVWTDETVPASVDPDLIPDEDPDPESDLPRVSEMNRDAVRALAAQWKVPGRGTLNRDELAAKLVELGRARP